jgi:hypothetical protein
MTGTDTKIRYDAVTIHVGGDNDNHTNGDSTIKVEKGGTLTLVNDSKEFEEFEVEFRNSAPPHESDKLKGDKEIVLHAPLELKRFDFYILYRHKGGRCVKEEFRHASTCGPC